MTAPRNNNQSLLPYFGLMISAAGIIYQSGVVTSKVDRNTERIAKLEAADAARQSALDTINLRGARIEAKLDYLMPDKPRRSEQ